MPTRYKPRRAAASSGNDSALSAVAVRGEGVGWPQGRSRAVD